MIDLEIIKPRQLEGKSCILFSTGDVEAQDRLWPRATAKYVLQELDAYLRLSTLLVDVTVHSPSYFWESRLSRQMYRTHSVLFTSGINNLYALRSEAPDYFEHLEKKRKLCPDMQVYQGSKATSYASELQSLGIALYREGDISEGIAQLWIKDLDEEAGNGFDNGSLDAMLVENFRNPNKEEKYRKMLRQVAEKREDFELVRPYVERQLKLFPKPLMGFVNDRLLYFYLNAVSDTMRVKLMDINGNTLYHGKQGISKQNIPLFSSFLKIIGIYPTVLSMTDIQLLDLKSREECRNVRQMYLNLVDEAKTLEENKRKLYWEELKDRLRIKYSQFSGIFKRASQIILLISLSKTLPPMENTAISLLTPEMVDLLIGRLIHVDRTPLNDLKRVVLEQYGQRLDRFAARMPNGVRV